MGAETIQGESTVGVWAPDSPRAPSLCSPPAQGRRQRCWPVTCMFPGSSQLRLCRGSSGFPPRASAPFSPAASLPVPGLGPARLSLGTPFPVDVSSTRRPLVTGLVPHFVTAAQLLQHRNHKDHLFQRTLGHIKYKTKQTRDTPPPLGFPLALGHGRHVDTRKCSLSLEMWILLMFGGNRLSGDRDITALMTSGQKGPPPYPPPWGTDPDGGQQHAGEGWAPGRRSTAL